MSVNDKTIQEVFFSLTDDIVRIKRFGETEFTEVFGEEKERLKKERGFN